MQRDFLQTYVQGLLDNGPVRRNNISRWAYAALPARKAGGDGFRITVDYQPVNKLMVPLAGATPNLTAVSQSVLGGSLPLLEECQELLSFVTEEVPQGASDPAIHFQLHMHECFREMLYNSVDDVLLFSKSATEFLEKPRNFCQILRRRDLELNANKCTRFALKAIWCGKVIDGEGVQHDPARLATLHKVPLPTNSSRVADFPVCSQLA
ncbi:hypothetical protein PHPALM_31477 [Phytophthora palmivora]|uniref:Reverse transcriptase domain-containing protein n=1 Tax=Phytophthora palmivora TaxID=4796 RepID=A0A2P4X2H4_9STRA|nr:hypothetical protein PHPALM_31477 [Phytophthora palmivora]